tara:strand:- start:537 stop:689 length:153 start_codon:yes stop_codon:yes gene_type:complete
MGTAELLAEAEHVKAQIDALPPGARVLPLYLRLKQLLAQVESGLKEERSR